MCNGVYPCKSRITSQATINQQHFPHNQNHVTRIQFLLLCERKTRAHATNYGKTALPLMRYRGAAIFSPSRTRWEDDDGEKNEVKSRWRGEGTRRQWGINGVVLWISFGACEFAFPRRNNIISVPCRVRARTRRLKRDAGKTNLACDRQIGIRMNFPTFIRLFGVDLAAALCGFNEFTVISQHRPIIVHRIRPPVRVFLCDGVVFEDQGRTWRLSSISLVLHKNKTTFQSFREEFLSWLEKVSHIWLNELINNLIQTLTSILEFFRISWKPRGGRRFGLNINDPVYRRSIEKYSYLVACIIEPLMYFQPSNRQFRRWLKNSSGEITIDTANTYQVSYHGCYVTS